MKALWALSIALLVCGPAHAKLKVTATVSDLGVLAREVGGEHVDVSILAVHTQDPHFVDARHNLVLPLFRSDLLLLMGMDLEVGWLPALLTTARNAKIQPGASGYLDCSTLISPLEVPTQRVDRSMGDVHPGGNPHYTKDPRRGIELARAIAQRMAELDAPNAAAYRANAERLAQTLRQKIAAWEKLLATAKGQPIVTYHRSWIYFAQWAGLDTVGHLEPKPGLPPSAGHITKILQLIQSRKVRILLQEDWYSAATSELLSKNSGAVLVRVPGMADPSKTYADHIDTLVEKVSAAFSKS